jgi:hypothetical protein
MEEAGIPRRKAMQITGHLTEDIYKRYDIGTETDATEAGRQLWEHERQQNEQKFANEFANGEEDQAPHLKTKNSDKHLN